MKGEDHDVVAVMAQSDKVNIFTALQIITHLQRDWLVRFFTLKGFLSGCHFGPFTVIKSTSKGSILPVV